MDGDIYLLFLLLLLILLPLLLFIVLSLLKWYQIRQLIKRFKPLNQPSGTSVPIQFSWMDVLFTQYSPSNLLLYSSNESIFHIRTKYSQNKPVYITYTRQQYTSLFPRISSIRFLTPYYVVITNLQIAKQVLEDSERWIKVGRQNTGVLASLMSLACTSMNDEVGKRQRTVLIEALKNVRNVQDALVEYTFLHLKSALTSLLTSSLTQDDSIPINDSLSVTHMDEEDAWPSSSVSSSGTVDIASAVSEASLRLLSRLVFGFSTSKSFDSQQSNSGAENSLYQGLTYDSLVQRFSDEFLVLWRIIRTNTLMFTPTQTAERINNLTISVRTVKSLLQVLISRRIIILNIRSTIISGSSTSASGGKKDDQSCESEEMQYCLLDGLLPYLKQSIASTNTANVSDTKNSPSSDIMNTNIVSDQCGSVVGSLSSDTKYMTREELIHNLNNLLLAGFETTAHSLIVSLHHLAHCSSEVANLLSLSESNQSQVGSDTSSVGRDQTKKVIVKTLVRESLRLHPPVLQAARVCRQDTPLLLPSISGDISTQSGWMCPEGTPAIIDFIAIMRHTDIWSKIYCEPCTQQNTTSDVISNVNKLNPDVFNLHRWLVASSNHEHKDKDKDKNKDSKQPCPQCEELLELRKQHWIPFGIGPKSCIGRGVALFATEGLLVRLLSHFTFTPPHGTAISNNSSSSSSIYHYRGADSDESYSDKYTLPPVDQTPTLRFTQGLKLHIRVLSPEQPPH